MQPKLHTEIDINIPLIDVWNMWTNPEDITKWYHASEGWTIPFAENNLTEGGVFKTAFASPDGVVQFVLEGTYTEVTQHSRIAYTLLGGREVIITLSEIANGTRITQGFDPENQNPLEMQQTGWQNILVNFKNYCENKNTH